jgi:hypothetical protein
MSEKTAEKVAEKIVQLIHGATFRGHYPKDLRPIADLIRKYGDEREQETRDKLEEPSLGELLGMDNPEK